MPRLLWAVLAVVLIAAVALVGVPVSGLAVSGPMAGTKLARIRSITEFWFDWQARHSDTLVHEEWQPRPAAR